METKQKRRPAIASKKLFFVTSEASHFFSSPLPSILVTNAKFVIYIIDFLSSFFFLSSLHYTTLFRGKSGHLFKNSKRI